LTFFLPGGIEEFNFWNAVQIIETLGMKRLSLDGSKAVQTISRILSLFSPLKDEIGIREASQILHLPPANIHRLFHSMDEAGLLEKTKERRYRIGERMFEIGALYSHNFPLRKIVRPHAEELARKFKTTVNFAIPSRRNPHLAITIDRIPNWQSHFSVQRLALNVPLHCTGVGKAIFAFYDPKKQEKLLKSIQLTPFTKRTITSPKILLAQLRKIRREGIAYDRGELYENIFCLGAPLLQNGEVVGSLSLTDTVDRINEKNYRKFAQALKEKAEFISRQL